MISVMGDDEFRMPEGSPSSKRVSDVLEDEHKVPNSLFVGTDKCGHIIEKNEYNKKKIVNNETRLVMMGMLSSKGSDSNKRVYHSSGLSPTLTSMNGGNRQPKIMVDEKTIRKLSPIECWRLMGYKDSDFYLAKEVGCLSNSKLYERAGRGIVVPMLEDVFKGLFIDEQH